jgi:hypothetical protein
VVLSAGLIAPASADTVSPTGRVGQIVEAASLKLLQQRGASEIDRRLTSLDQMSARIDDAAVMTPAHRDALKSTLDADRTALNSLKTKLSAETDESAARTEVQSIFSQFRVYAVLVPKVHLVRSADAVSAAATQLQDAAAGLDTVTARLKAAGKDTTAAEASIAEVRRRSQTALDEVKGAADTALSLQAQGYPANTSQRDAAQQSIEKASADARAGLEALRTAVAQLRPLSGQ